MVENLSFKLEVSKKFSFWFVSMSALSILVILALFIFLVTTFGQIIWFILLGLLIILVWYAYDWWSATKVRFVIKEDRLLMVGSWGSVNITFLFNDFDKVETFILPQTSISVGKTYSSWLRNYLVPKLGRILSIMTRKSGILLVKKSGENYFITPERQSEFLEVLQSRIAAIRRP